VTAVKITLIAKGTPQAAKAVYIKISPEEAKAMIDGETVIVLDVRTQAEFDEGHIENAVLLPNTEISSLAESLLPDKNSKILVYCRSGNRSSQASKILLEMGYTQVFDFGGIMDWPYDVVKD
jgi:rhodanese-related sulfurtransferase